MNDSILKNLENIILHIKNDLRSCNLDFNEINNYSHFQFNDFINIDFYNKLMLYKIIINLKDMISLGRISTSENSLLNFRVLHVCSSDIINNIDIMSDLINDYYSSLLVQTKRVMSKLFVTIYLGKLKVKLNIRCMDSKSPKWTIPQFNDYTIVDNFNTPHLNYSFKQHSKCTFMPIDPNDINITNDIFVISGEYIDFIKPEDLFL